MRRFCLGGALAAAGLTVILTVSAGAAGLGTGVVEADALRLRAGTDTSTAILSMVYRGAKVEVLEDAGNGWYKISYNGQTGYVAAEYVNVSWEAGDELPDEPVPEAAQGNNGKVDLSSYEVLNLRSGPSTETDKLGTIPGGTVLALEEEADGWYKVTYGGKTGYVCGDYIVATDEEPSLGNGKVDLDSYGVLNLRSGPSTETDKLGSIPGGTVLALEKKVDGWYKVTYRNVTGYVSGDYIVPTTEPVTTSVTSTASTSYSSSAAGSSSGGSAVSYNGSFGSSIAALAKQYLGCPYVWGASGPYSFDCSGLTYYLYKQMGYAIPRGGTSQYYSGVAVDRWSLQPGDLVFFANPAYTNGYPISHVGIYIGNSQYVHAASTGEGVTIGTLFSDYNSQFYAGARRIVS